MTLQHGVLENSTYDAARIFKTLSSWEGLLSLERILVQTAGLTILYVPAYPAGILCFLVLVRRDMHVPTHAQTVVKINTTIFGLFSE